MDIFVEFLAFDEELNEVAQALDEAVVQLLPPSPNQVPPQQDPTQTPLPDLVYNSESELNSDNELDPDLSSRISLFPPQGSNEKPTTAYWKQPFLSRTLLPLLTLLTAMIGMDCNVTELVVFHPVDQIYNSISSWILTAAIHFHPYKDALFGINQYALKVHQSLPRYSESFQSNDLR